MKYSMIILVLLLLGTTSVTARKNSNFLKEKMIDLQYGNRSGELSKREFTVLKRELKAYRKTLKQFKSNDKLSRRERKKLRKLENLIDKQFYSALNNQETARGAKRKSFKKRKAKTKRGAFTNGPICIPPVRRSGNIYK